MVVVLLVIVEIGVRRSVKRGRTETDASRLVCVRMVRSVIQLMVLATALETGPENTAKTKVSL